MDREEGVRVSSALRSSTGLSVHQTFTGHSLRRCLDTSDMLPGFCPRVSYSFVSSTDGKFKEHKIPKLHRSVLSHCRQLQGSCDNSRPTSSFMLQSCIQGYQSLFFRECLKIHKYERNYFSNLPHSYHTVRK